MARICACNGNFGTCIGMSTYDKLGEVGFRGWKNCSLDKPFPSYADQKKHVLLSRACLRAQGIEEWNKLHASEILRSGIMNQIGSMAFEDLKKDENFHTLHNNFN